MRIIIFCLITLLLYVIQTTRAAQVVSENFDNNFNESVELFGYGEFTIGESPNRAVFTGGTVVDGTEPHLLYGSYSAFMHSSPGFWRVSQKDYPILNGYETDEDFGIITFESPPAKVEFYAVMVPPSYDSEAAFSDGTIEVYDANGYLISTITDLPININPAEVEVPELISIDANELGAPHGIGKIIVITRNRVFIDDFQYTPIVLNTLVQAPTITTHPLNQELPAELFYINPSTGKALIYGKTTLSVVATGNDLTYQWYAGVSGDTTTPIDGATSTTFSTETYGHLYPNTITPWSVTSVGDVNFTPIGTTTTYANFKNDIFTLLDYPPTDQSDKYTESFTLGESPYSATFTGGSVGRAAAVSVGGSLSSYSGLYYQRISFRKDTSSYQNFYDDLINQGLTVPNGDGLWDIKNEPHPLIDVVDPTDVFWFISNGETATITFETPVINFSWALANFLDGDATAELYDANGDFYDKKTGIYETGFKSDMNAVFGTNLLSNGDVNITYSTAESYGSGVGSTNDAGYTVEDVGGISKIVLKDNGTIFNDVGMHNFWVQVSNEGGRANSDTAVITVTDTGLVPLVLEGSGEVVGEAILHPSGNIYDQILLTGESIKLQANPGHITRVSFLDVNGDIVQVEFSGAGNFTLTLDPETYLPPALPAFYNQNVEYVTGKPSIVIDGIPSNDSSTYLSIFTVGKINAVNQALFPEGQEYDGQADVTLVEIINSEWVGGLQLSNAVFSGSSGKIGVDARGVQIAIRLTLGDIDASGTAIPHLLFAPDSFIMAPSDNTGMRITGGDLLQTNGAAVVIAESGSTTPGFETLISQNNFKSDNTPMPTLSIDATFANEDGDPITVTTEELTIE